MWNYFLILHLFACIVNANHKWTYNTYRREPATCEEKQEFEERSIDDTCLVTFEPCDENEWRRYDGSCNNLKYPSHGSINTPEWRMVPAQYGEGYEPKRMTSGEAYPLARSIRTQILNVGGGIDQKFTMGAAYFLEFITADYVSIHDTENYVLQITHCCAPEGLNDDWCVPNEIPIDDDVHRYSGHRCINMTRPKTFQNMGCVSSDTPPSRMNRVTPHLDLTSVYFYNGSDAGAVARREYEGGRLKEETVNGISLPSDATETTTCFVKQARETGCMRNVANALPGTSLFTIWFHRFHNFLARGLQKQNPHWSDDILYNTAMDINIAMYTQILFYELYPELLDKESMIEAGIIGSHDGFRDPYDENIAPSMSTEYIYATRWFHLVQEGLQELYDKNHKLYRTAPMANFSLRIQDFAYDDNMVGFTHSMFLQKSGRFDDRVIDADMVNVPVGPWQQTLDVPTNDLAKGRFFGIASYPDYRDFCVNYSKKHKKFEDFKDVMCDANIELMEKIYKVPANMELIAGMWMETLPKGRWVPPTLECIIMTQLKRSVITDRHWYERPNRPHAFTRAQLREVRKASLASLLCSVGDDVLRIQPKAFLRPGPRNRIVSCENIPKIDLSLWKETPRKWNKNSKGTKNHSGFQKY